MNQDINILEQMLIWSIIHYLNFSQIIYPPLLNVRGELWVKLVDFFFFFIIIIY